MISTFRGVGACHSRLAPYRPLAGFFNGTASQFSAKASPSENVDDPLPSSSVPRPLSSAVSDADDVRNSRALSANLRLAEKLKEKSEEDLKMMVEELRRKREELEEESRRLGGGCEEERREKRCVEEEGEEEETVAMLVSYLGWNMTGFSRSHPGADSVQDALLGAVEAAGLTPSEPASSEVSPSCHAFVGCGRTDAGVSATHQVVSMRMRRKWRKADAASDPSTPAELAALNSFLPPEIRVLAWSPVEPDFSARFHCWRREYTYYFPKGDLDLSSMRSAASRLLGLHDFRNFCDINNDIPLRIALYGEEPNTLATPFVKCLHEVDVEEVGRVCGIQMCRLKVSGDGFLWHQIRFVVGLLFLVGRRLEDPDVVDRMLDVDRTPGRPEYLMASPLPLVFSGCEFLSLSSWRISLSSFSSILSLYRRRRAALCAASAAAGVLASHSHRRLESSVRRRLCALLERRRRQLENPVGFAILDAVAESERERRRNYEDNEDLSSKVNQLLHRPYEPLQRCGWGTGRGSVVAMETSDASPYYLDPDGNLFERRGKRRRRSSEHRPIEKRKMALTLNERVEKLSELIDSLGIKRGER